MATGAVVNQGKTAFVEKYFASHPDGNLETANKAWTAAGNSGTVSESLVGKIRAKLGLTGKKAADEPKPSGAPTKAKSKASVKVRKAKPVGLASPVSNGSLASTIGHEDDEVLDELEENIDELIHKIKGLGGRPDVVKALRRARRLLVRSHEG